MIKTDWKPIKDYHENKKDMPRFVLTWVGECVIAEYKRNRQGEEWWETSAGETDDCYQKPSHFAVVTEPKK